LTRGSNSDRIVTATLQAVAYQTHDLISAMAEDGIEPSVVRVDGGMAGNDWFLQFLADILGVPVQRPMNIESTVLGAAYLAGYQAGIFSSTEDISRRWQLEAEFAPNMKSEQRLRLLERWREAVQRVLSNS
jgi:glycerol kinase